MPALVRGGGTWHMCHLFVPPDYSSLHTLRDGALCSCHNASPNLRVVCDLRRKEEISNNNDYYRSVSTYMSVSKS